MFSHNVINFMKFVFALFLYIFPLQIALSQTKSIFIEDLTWEEVRDEIAGGKTIAIYLAGSTEQNGSHLVLGKHNIVSRYIAEQVARELGNALVYPVLPFAPTGDPATKTRHMRYPGTVNLSDSVFAAVANDVAMSALAAGFTCVVLMGDHGGGQKALEAVALSLDSACTPKGSHVYYIPDVYFKAKQEMKKYLADHELPEDDHAGIDDTSELLFLDDNNQWVRKDKLDGNVTKATRELGGTFIRLKIKNAVEQIRHLLQK